MAVTAQKEGRQWSGKAAIYKDAGPIAGAVPQDLPEAPGEGPAGEDYGSEQVLPLHRI